VLYLGAGRPDVIQQQREDALTDTITRDLDAAFAELNAVADLKRRNPEVLERSPVPTRTQ